MIDNVFPVVNYPDIRLASGEGSWVTDTRGKRYLDLNSGQFCASSGHSSDVLKTAVHDFMNSLQDTHTGMLSVQAQEGLKSLGEISGFRKPYSVMLSTGSEAVEFAIRYAKHIKEKDGIVAFDIGYHGITHGAAGYSLSRSKIRPPLEKSYVIPAPRCKNFDEPENFHIEESINELRRLLERNHKDVAAFIVEPVISGGGMFKVPDEFMRQAINLCHEHDVFVIFDECQTGGGRLGRWYSYSEKDYLPDFVVAGKSIGMGLPVASVTARGESVDLARVSMEHFSSHQNEPFSGVIISSFVKWMKEERKLDFIRDIGCAFLSELQGKISEYGVQVRGEGLMIGFDISHDQPGPGTIQQGNLFIKRAADEGIILQHCNFGRTIRVLPNYNLQNSEILFFGEKLRKVFLGYEKYS
jgi:4-aminobutyrate aminotransferase-like enzyme